MRTAARAGRNGASETVQSGPAAGPAALARVQIGQGSSTIANTRETKADQENATAWARRSPATPSASEESRSEPLRPEPALASVLSETDELLARVDARIKAHEAALAAEQARKDQQAAEAAAKAAQDSARSEKRRQNGEKRLAKLDALIARNKTTLEQRGQTARQKFSFGPSGCDITCGNPDCRYQGDAGEFWKTRLGMDRPRGEIQCPRCNWAVRQTWVHHEIKLVPIQPTL